MAASPNQAQDRRFSVAAALGERTTACEPATCRQIDRARWITLKPPASVTRALNMRLWNGRHQRPCVGVQGLSEQGNPVRLLNDLAQIHDGDVIAKVFHHPQVMRNKQESEPKLGLQLSQQIQDLRLNGDVQR